MTDWLKYYFVQLHFLHPALTKHNFDRSCTAVYRLRGEYRGERVNLSRNSAPGGSNGNWPVRVSIRNDRRSVMETDGPTAGVSSREMRDGGGKYGSPTPVAPGPPRKLRNTKGGIVIGRCPEERREYANL